MLCACLPFILIGCGGRSSLMSGGGRGGAGGVLDAGRDAGVDARFDAPADAPLDAPTDAPFDAPLDAPTDAPPDPCVADTVFVADWSSHQQGAIDVVALAATPTGMVVAENLSGPATMQIRMLSQAGTEVGVVVGVPNAGVTLEANDVAADGEGALYVTGLYDGTVDLAGVPLEYPDCPGCSGLGMFVARLDAQGAVAWARGYAAAGLERPVVAVDGLGQAYLAGLVRGAIDFGGGTLPGGSDRDVYLVKLDPDGGHLWSRRYGDGSAQQLNGIDVNQDGAVVLGGPLAGTMDFGGEPLVGTGWADGYVARLDPGGQHLWSRSVFRTVLRVALDSAGDVYTLGADFDSPPTDGLLEYLCKLASSSGSMMWKRVPWHDGAPFHLKVDALCDNVVVLDRFTKGLMEYGPAGQLYGQWTLPSLENVTFPPGSDEQTFAVDPEGSVYHAGRFSGTVDFGSGPMVSDDAAFVVRFSQQ